MGSVLFKTEQFSYIERNYLSRKLIDYGISNGELGVVNGE